MNIIEREQQASFDVFPKRELVITHGSGATLWDEQGRAYIDCTSGVGVANIGHANPDVAHAIAQQAKNLITCPGIFYNDTRAKLVSKLASITPDGLNRVFLCNSGTEANEAAIKFARRASGKSEFICAMRGFHGRTMGALSATHKHRDYFNPLIPGFDFVPYNNLEKMEQKITALTAGIILEIVQGEGGVRPGSQAYFDGVQNLCKKHNVLLIVDEIQTGFCRTGKMFACEHFDVRPDILCLAKAMAGGVPIGAVVCADNIPAEIGLHGTTFGGNPIACAAGLAAIRYMEQHELAKEALLKGNYFHKLLNATSSSRVREIRHLGLMIGIELREKAKPFLLKLMEEGVLALPAGATVIRLLPPLTISEQELHQVVDTLHKVLAD